MIILFTSFSDMAILLTNTSSGTSRQEIMMQQVLVQEWQSKIRFSFFPNKLMKDVIFQHLHFNLLRRGAFMDMSNIIY